MGYLYEENRFIALVNKEVILEVTLFSSVLNIPA
jgi:hypothetical protein